MDMDFEAGEKDLDTLIDKNKIITADGGRRHHGIDCSMSIDGSFTIKNSSSPFFSSSSSSFFSMYNHLKK